MSVIVAIEEAGPSRKRLRVSVPADEVAAETRAVVGELGRTARVSGFRRGKVPASVVRQRYRETIEREVVDRLLPRAWRRAEEEGGLSPLAPPRVEEVGPLAEGEPLTFSATVEVRPAIRLGAAEIEGADEFELPDPPVEATDQEVADAIDDLRRRVADWVPADRPAARGDRVRATITEIVPEGSAEQPAEQPGEAAEAQAAEPAPPTAGQPQEAVVEIGDPRVWEELALALTGLAAGQEGRFTRRPEGDASARSFRVRVEAVEERDLPPLDDEFARKIGDYDDVETLRREVVAGLTAKKRADRGQERRRALMQQLRSRHPVELPRGVVDHELEHLLSDYATELGRRGVDPERAQVDWQGLAAQVRPEAERRVHDRLLLDAAAEELGVEIGEADLTAALAVLARARGQSAAELRRGLAESGRLDGLREQLRRDRALDRLLGEDARRAETAPAPAAAAP